MADWTRLYGNKQRPLKCEQVKGYLLRTCYSKGVSHLHFNQLKAGRGVGGLGSGKREVFGYALIAGYWHGKL